MATRKKAKEAKAEESAEDSLALEALPPLAAGLSTDQSRRQGEDFRRLYANNVTLTFSMWDMSMTFGEIVGEDNGKPLIEERVKVTMSLQHGKVLAAILSKNILRFEKETGEISIPDFSGGEE